MCLYNSIHTPSALHQLFHRPLAIWRPSNSRKLFWSTWRKRTDPSLVVNVLWSGLRFRSSCMWDLGWHLNACQNHKSTYSNPFVSWLMEFSFYCAFAHSIPHRESTHYQRQAWSSPQHHQNQLYTLQAQIQNMLTVTMTLPNDVDICLINGHYLD